MLRFIEKTLTSLVFSAVIMLCSFSYLTGKFPPSKQELVRAFTLMKSMVGSTGEVQAAQGEVQAQIKAGKEPNLEQIAKYQELALKRTKIGLELLQIYPKIQMNAGQSDFQVHLDKIYSHLSEVDKEMALLADSLKPLAQE